ncbi:MAG TPA: VCBS repeat-containing protein [Isosphaeraceae bacterium]|nr:VCBS repeat-containing protein [Isosphaeraceae bacterium]
MDRLAPRGWGLLTSLALIFWAPSALAQPTDKKLADYFGFQPLELYKLDNRIGNLHLVDLDGDKVDDIFVTNNGRSRIDLFLSSKKPADDNSSRPFRKDANELEYDRRMRLVSIPVNKAVVSVDTGDFNGDGKPDLVFYGTPAEVEILFNEGKGRFGSPKKINTGDAIQRPAALAVGDFDQDGRDDLALLAEKELVFVYQTAAGIMGEPERVPHTAASPWLIRAVDLDGDGAKDLVILDTESEHPIHVRFATDEKKLGPEQRFALEVPSAVAFGQVDGKGGSEILVLEGQSGRAKVLTLDQSSDDDANRRGRLAFFGLPQGSERGRSLAVGDLDGDHRKDVIVTDPANAQVWVYVQSGRAGLSAGLTFPSLGNARTVRLAHQESGGKDEVYVLSEQEKQVGRSIFEKGRLSFPTPLSLTGEPVAMDVVDLDGDKAPEILYVSRAKAKTDKDADAFELRAVTRDKAGAYQPTKWGEVDSVALPDVKAVPAAVKTLDINQDGQMDLLIFKEYGAPLLVLGEKGGPPRPFTGSLGPLSGVAPAGVSLANLDGPAVIVAQNTYARRVTLDADGHWNIKDQYNAGRNSAQIVGATALDTDGDGTKEIVMLDRATKSLLFLSMKDGVYRPSGRLLIGTINFIGMSVADLDGDGRDDLLIAGTDRFAVLQTGRKGQRLKTIASYESKRTEARLTDLAIGDVNGDGLPDVVFSDVAEQSLEIATYAGDPELIPAITFKIFERKTFRNVGDVIEPRDMAIGDVDGDGRADIVLVIHDRVVVLRQDAGKPGAKPEQPTVKSSTASRPAP